MIPSQEGKYRTILKIIKLLSLVLMIIMLSSCTQNYILSGSWKNLTTVHQVKPGDLTVILDSNGSGKILYDKKKYFWFWSEFEYSIRCDEIIIKPADDSPSNAYKAAQYFYKRESIEKFKQPIKFRILGNKIVLIFLNREYEFQKTSNY